MQKQLSLSSMQLMHEVTVHVVKKVKNIISHSNAASYHLTCVCTVCPASHSDVGGVGSTRRATGP